MGTHEVFNQPPPLFDYDSYGADAALAAAVRREGAAWADEELCALGRIATSPQVIAWGEAANANPPQLHTHDRYGHRRDEVVYHPAYHDLMSVAVRHGLHATPWSDTRSGAHVARAAKLYLWNPDAGHTCPISMTYSSVPALRATPALAAEWEPRLAASTYDPAFRPAHEKAGALVGMAMTEKQGGSDVRANTTRAVPLADGRYALTGHKWFCSAPMSDAFLVLAQAPAGLSCFLLPRWLPDGTRNRMHLQRLKDKLGNRSNASSEVEYDGAVAWLVGDEGRGVATIIEMVARTRLDCVLGSASSMRVGVAQATHHAAYRAAFGRSLLEQPLMRNVLADLAVESEAATSVALRLAGAYDRGARGDASAAPAGWGSGYEEAFARLATPVAKYWVCKRATPHAAEALECLGGNGYVEESGMPRLLRDAPLNGIWEGSGNVICLDVLRALTRNPESAEAFRAEVGAAAGGDARLDAHLVRLDRALSERGDEQTRARRMVETMALALAGALLVRHGHPAVADAFCASRLGGDWGQAFGTLPHGADLGAILARARPKVA